MDNVGDRLFVANSGGNDIRIFNAASAAEGNVFPARILSGANAQLNGPASLLVDGANNLFVANASSILRFTPADTVEGDVAPTAVLSGSNTLLAQPSKLVLDSGGNLYVANSGSNAVLVFNSAASQQTGNPFPDRRLEGQNTRLNGPAAMALDPSR